MGNVGIAERTITGAQLGTDASASLGGDCHPGVVAVAAAIARVGARQGSLLGAKQGLDGLSRST